MNLSVRSRIFLGVVLIQLASAALVAGWYFYTVNADLKALSRDSAEETVLQAIAATKEYFAPPAAVARLTQSLIAGGVLDRARPDQLERFLLEQLRRSPHAAGLFVGYPDGGFLYVSRSDEVSPGGTRTKVIRQQAPARAVELTWRDRELNPVRTAADPEDAYDPRTRTWYQAASERRELAWTEPYVFFTARTPGITAAVPVLGPGRAIEAVVGVDLEIGAVSRFLVQIGIRGSGTAYIVAPNGDVIAHSREGLIFPDRPQDGEALRFRKAAELPGIEGAVGRAAAARAAQPGGAAATTVREEESDGRRYYVVSGGIGDADWPWQVVAIVPAAGFARTLASSNLLLLGVLVIATALACLVGYMVARHVGRPIATLRRNAQLARNGNVELMDDPTGGYPEIDEANDALRELAAARRGRG